MTGKVIVAGGAGYIGSHTCKALKAAGFEPVVVDDLSAGHEWAVQWGPLEKGNIADSAFLRSVFERHEPVAVLHFAAYLDVGESVRKPAKYWRNNVVGTFHLLEAAREAGVWNVIFSSTAATYGEPQIVPIPVDHSQLPINAYGRTKLVIEQMLRDYHEAYGLKWVALRYFNAAGADPEGDIGEAHDPEIHLIPLALDAVAGRRERLYVFGNDYPTPDGTCVRDYVHVTDLADAHVRALEYLGSGGAPRPFNLGTGNGYSVRQVLDTVAAVSGRKMPAEDIARRPGDPSALVADPSDSNDILGWKPNHSSLEEIVRTAWQWHQRDE